jgi:cytochrome bd ubiquinol oxidase subunit II
MIDLPMIWGGIIALTVFMYVFLDGFDLGLGILFPFAPSEACRDKMMNSIAPFWDGNETWLVFGGGALFVAFPLAYAILMPAFYIPIVLMLCGLIFRGVAFEFRFKAEGSGKKLWDFAFHFGSIIATFFQGVILGTYIQGIKVAGHHFAGGTFDWATPFSLTVGLGLLSGYVLLGSTWLIMKTEGEVYLWAKKISLYIVFYIVAFLALISLWTPTLNEHVFHRWFTWPNIAYLLPIPITALGLIAWIIRSIHGQGHDRTPFLCSIGVFILTYLGLAISLWPWVVPFSITLHEASSVPSTQRMMLIGVSIFLPIILGYTGYCYYIFRGKVTNDGYHT